MKAKSLLTLALLLAALQLAGCNSGEATPEELMPVQQTPPPVAAAPAPVAAPKPAPKPVCQDCGTVTRIDNAADAKKVTGGGAVIGAVIGGLIGNQVGKEVGKGNKTRTVGTVAGAAAGAYTGHQIEKDVKTHTYFKITVKMDNGTTRVANVEQTNGLGVGSRVKVAGDNLSPL